MKDVVIIFNNCKTVHYLNAEYHYENGDVVVKEYEQDEHGGYHLADIYHFDKSEIKEIKYEG